MKASQAWQAALGQLQMEMPKAAFDTWVRDAEMLSYEDGSFMIGVQNAYARDWLDSRLSSTVTRLLTGIMNRSVEVRFVVWQDTNKSSEHRDIPTSSPEALIEFTNPTINGRYSFSNFIVGASNRLAHAASLAVAEKPAQAYNPFFLYGGVGLGKTHLLHAIGNQCVQSGMQVLYVSSEEFTNDLINAIRTHTTQAFREKYRRTDILLVDDVQFIAGKESTQEEFFHTFNTLHGQDKQIVMSSDRPPKAMVTLEERLRSRFEWGLTADIQPPDYETRVAILRSKAERAGYRIPDDIIEIIARKFQSNIRELEGALTRVVAYADLRGMPMTPQLIDSSLADMLPRRADVQPDQVINTVAHAYGVPMEQMMGRGRSRQVARPRQIAMYLLREDTKISLPQIGEALGGRDHTTVMYGCSKIADLLERDDKLRRQVIAIREQLYGQSTLAV
ncbi:MAG: chromosomal replication initiator protein DnaA [Chloroflexi bacterium]|nr:chromosomal replication initiator protein DnaA [Chloroflexota bacterium]MBU1660903.1 chromosomal replication initiator protein DnaA [Chloroflexota bacterium]